MEAVAVRRNDEARPVAALAEDAVRAFEGRDARPVQCVRMDGDVVTLHQVPQPIVEASDHDRADRRYRRDIAASVSQRVEASLHGFRHGDGLRDGEADSGIDVDARCSRELNRLDPCAGRRELDLDVRGQPGEPDALLEHSLGVRVVLRVRLHGQPALVPTLAPEDRLEDARASDCHLLDECPRDIRLRPDRILEGKLPDPRDPVRLLATQHIEHDARIGGGAGRAASDGILEVGDRTRVVPVVGRRVGSHPEQGALDEALQRGSGHRVPSSGCTKVRVEYNRLSIPCQSRPTNPGSRGSDGWLTYPLTRIVRDRRADVARRRGDSVPKPEEILGQFLGDASFPVAWDSEVEKDFFWVYDDLHCPHPVSPMFFDIGGWWLTCDHMFRRFGTPFAVDWLAKNVNGYVYTTAIPPDPALRIDSTEYSARYGARVPRDADFGATMGAYLDTVLPVYGDQFADWWRDRFRPEMERNFVYLEARLDDAERMTLAEVACLLEDAIDIHDRHWKIHWMLNFAQLSATLTLRAVMEKTHGKINEQLLGRLQNSAKDRNWDSIEALWKMKEEAQADSVLSVAFKHDTAQEIIAALKATERGKRFIADRVVPYQKEYGWHAVWSHEFIFPTVREHMAPVIELVRGYIETNYDYPKTIAALAADIAAAAKEILEGLTGEALEEMRAANDINLKMAPLTPDHHFYIDQGANAHVRMPLILCGQKLVEMGALDSPEDVVHFKYNEFRVFMGNPSAMDGRAIVAKSKAAREKAYTFRPKEWIGTCTPTQLAFPYLNLWGFPDKFHRKESTIAGQVQGIGGSPGIVEGIARVVLREDQFDTVRAGDVLVCQMTNPAWVVLFTKIVGLVTDAGGTVSHPAVLSREFGIPAVVGSSVATRDIKNGDRIRINGTTGLVEILQAAALPKNDLMTSL